MFVLALRSIFDILIFQIRDQAARELTPKLAPYCGVDPDLIWHADIEIFIDNKFFPIAYCL